MWIEDLDLKKDQEIAIWFVAMSNLKPGSETLRKDTLRWKEYSPRSARLTEKSETSNKFVSFRIEKEKSLRNRQEKNDRDTIGERTLMQEVSLFTEEKQSAIGSTEQHRLSKFFSREKEREALSEERCTNTICLWSIACLACLKWTLLDDDRMLQSLNFWNSKPRG